MNIRPSARFIRFLWVGGLNTLFGYAVFLTCLWLGMHYALSAGISTVLGVLFNFRSTGKLVFGKQDVRLLPLFVGVYVVVYLVNVSGLTTLLNFGVPEWAGGLIMILPCAILSYVLNLRCVFRP